MNLLSPFLFAVSLLLVGFGQPAFSFLCSLFASLFGYALFWRVIVEYNDWKKRFWISTVWFFCVQLIQLSWMTAHPYVYIYFLLILCAFLMGMQFGILNSFIRMDRLAKISYVIALAGFWTIMEWARLFFIAGFSWNPVGLALTANIYSLQSASVWGIYGLSFWVIFVNLLALRAWLIKPSYAVIWASASLLPFLYGFVQLEWHRKAFEENPPFTALLVQTAFPIEEIQGFQDQKSMVAYVIDEWRQILNITKKHLGEPVDLIATPEYTVPYGTYSCLFPYSIVEASFREIYGPECLSKLPKLQEPLAMSMPTRHGNVWMVNNAYWAQAIANIFNAELVAGLEDAEEIRPGERAYYSAAIHFQPDMEAGETYFLNRYEKRVLLPMGEYIPSKFLKWIAQWYGIYGSFTPGKEAKVFGNNRKMGFSICYEETFSYLMRQNRLKGAELFLNLTSDVWYPYSRLMQQHFDHARPRAVENGIPLLRACNTGITSGIDSFGRVFAVLGESPEQAEWVADSIKVKVPTYSYKTLYAKFGDGLIIGISLFAIIICLIKMRTLI